MSTTPTDKKPEPEQNSSQISGPQTSNSQTSNQQEEEIKTPFDPPEFSDAAAKVGLALGAVYVLFNFQSLSWTGALMILAASYGVPMFFLDINHKLNN